jgi:mono/diheme cytochrome c family protein
MHDNPRYEPLEASALFADGAAARTPPAGTVPRGVLEERAEPAMSEALVRRGRERYDIHCAPCHDRLGNGAGIVVARGFKAPPSLHIPRLRAAPPSHFVDVILRGFGSMASAAHRVGVSDRWAIAAYIRALQLSQYAPAGTLPPTDRDLLP